MLNKYCTLPPQAVSIAIHQYKSLLKCHISTHSYSPLSHYNKHRVDSNHCNHPQVPRPCLSPLPPPLLSLSLLWWISTTVMITAALHHHWRRYPWGGGVLMVTVSSQGFGEINFDFSMLAFGLIRANHREFSSSLYLDYVNNKFDSILWI